MSRLASLATCGAVRVTVCMFYSLRRSVICVLTCQHRTSLEAAGIGVKVCPEIHLAPKFYDLMALQRGTFYSSASLASTCKEMQRT